ncbi:hypothetical protein B1757_00225 [Acidithiobacillus marinus]|uniref:Uncharacterized protein n=1 Tax=Acidithiobacillus marinus TaxID=187490 RepID=A0A2I1DQU7_9PROT|nr:tetratricopeptide repeat protein [Acidithiobacillus marinus]PKY12209.1 hypothetical protein B1757_00225 [Acidithiobacillus marinus]
MKHFPLLLGIFLIATGSAAFAHDAATVTPWWKAPGSLAADDAKWRTEYAQQKANVDAFAASLAQSIKSGKGMGYLDQGGISPSWYKPPMVVQPFPGSYSPELYDLAYSAFLQSGQLDEAYRLAYTAVLQKPESISWRQKLIQVGTWLGQRETVLQQWRWLARHKEPGALAAAVKLAAALSRPDIVIQLLSPLARAGRLSNADWKTLIYAYGQLSEPDKAISDINLSLQHTGPNRFLLEQKAYLSYQRGEIAQSLAALQSVQKHFKATPDIAIQEARLLSMQGKYAEAFAAMNRTRNQATLNDVPFWHLLAVLAWELHDHQAALDAEKKLYLLDAASQYDLQRLIMLVGAENPEAALAVAQRGWKKFQLPYFYFESLTYAGQAQHWKTLGQLLRSVPKHDPQGLLSYATYWLAMGQWANALKNYDLAESAYAEALHMNPEDNIAKNNLLWMLVDSGNVPALQALLVGDVLHPSTELHDVVMNALERLGHYRSALFLAQRTSQPSKLNNRQLLNKASLWESTGQSGIAWSMRQEAMAGSLAQLHHVLPQKKETTHE